MGTRIAQYSVNSEGGSFKNVVFQGRRSAAWYIRNFAGGFMKKANHNSVTVTYANDQMISTKRYLIFLRHYPTVRPGSIITLQMKPPKEKSDNKKYDWDSMIGKTSAAITSSLTLYLLITQLSKL